MSYFIQRTIQENGTHILTPKFLHEWEDTCNANMFYYAKGFKTAKEAWKAIDDLKKEEEELFKKIFKHNKIII